MHKFFNIEKLGSLCSLLAIDSRSLTIDINHKKECSVKINNNYFNNVFFIIN